MADGIGPAAAQQLPLPMITDCGKLGELCPLLASPDGCGRVLQCLEYIYTLLFRPEMTEVEYLLLKEQGVGHPHTHSLSHEPPSLPSKHLAHIRTFALPPTIPQL